MAAAPRIEPFPFGLPPDFLPRLGYTRALGAPLPSLTRCATSCTASSVMGVAEFVGAWPRWVPRPARTQGRRAGLRANVWYDHHAGLHCTCANVARGLAVSTCRLRRAASPPFHLKVVGMQSCGGAAEGRRSASSTDALSNTFLIARVYYSSASGLTGEPVAFDSLSGAISAWNSQRPSRAHVSASSS
jgi:hypothetical protein